MRKTLIAMTLGLGAVAAGAGAAGAGQPFTAHLTGGDAAGNIVDTEATGQAVFQVTDDGTAIRYRLNVAGIRNLWMAHIHVSAAPGGNGPPAFWFVPTTPGAPNTNVAERTQGTIAAGFIMTDAQVGGLVGMDGVAGLIQAMEEGRAYVVVHTNDLDPTTPSGVAGDSPPGELRGQIE